MCMTEKRQTEVAAPANSITVMEAAQPASPLDVEVFYNLLADILKRLVSEEEAPSVERKVG
jgi:hypothetical protein